MCASTGDGRAGGRGAARPSGALGRELAIGAPEGRDGAPTPALGYLFRHLATHPEHRRRLIDEPELIPSAVEEVLRFYAIIFGDGRKVTRDTEFHGGQLKKGDMVYALVSGANRDPRAYERTGEFVIDRQRNHHMGFANGPHRCLCAHLARRELQPAVEEWLRVIPDFHVATAEELEERGGGAMMTLTNLPLAWEVAS